MLKVPPGDRPKLRSFFLPERPGPQTALQAIGEPRDVCLVDRWPDPRAVVAVAPMDLVLAGDPAALDPEELGKLGFEGMIEAPDFFLPLLEVAFPDLRPWPRVVGVLEGGPPPEPAGGWAAQRLAAGDGGLLESMESDARWLWKHQRSAEALAASGLAWGAISGGSCVSLALPFTRGNEYEDLAVYTVSAFRGQNLSPACAFQVVEDVRRRGRTPSWATLRHNLASLRVAEKLGFRELRQDVVYMTGPAHPAHERSDADSARGSG